MGGTNVRLPLPLTRLNPWYPGQFGVLGTANETGLRQHSTGTVFYVDPNYPGVVDRRDGTDPLAPLATIQAAVDKCEPHRGDVILVMDNNAWQYTNQNEANQIGIVENVVVDVSGISIIGVGPSNSLGVVWSAVAAGDVAITVTGCDVLIEGFAFTDQVIACNAIFAEWDGTTAWGDNLTIRNCYFGPNVSKSIQLEYSWYGEIDHCRFDGCDYGVYVDPAGSGIQGYHIHDNWFTQVITAALALDDSVEADIHDNHLYNATPVGAGASANLFINTSAGRGNLVHSNAMSCLLPVPANGDYDDCNSAAPTDAWINNLCLDGPSITNPT